MLCLYRGFVGDGAGDEKTHSSGHDAVVLAAGRVEQLHRHGAADATEQGREACALVLFDLVGLSLLADGTGLGIQPGDPARVIGAECCRVDGAFVDEIILESVW